MNITDADREAAFSLAVEICGCANDEQRKRDIAAILAYGEAHRLRAVKDTLEAAAKVVESGMFNSRGQAQPSLVAKLRAMIEGETNET